MRLNVKNRGKVFFARRGIGEIGVNGCDERLVDYGKNVVVVSLQVTVGYGRIENIIFRTR